MKKRIAMIREEWPSIPGHGEECKLYPVRVVKEFEHSIIAKKHWFSRPKTYTKNGMFVKVEDIEL